MSIQNDTVHLSTKLNLRGSLTRKNENKCRIESNVGEEGQVVERVLLGPGPHTNCQNAQAQKLKKRKLKLLSKQKKYFFLQPENK